MIAIYFIARIIPSLTIGSFRLAPASSKQRNFYFFFGCQGRGKDGYTAPLPQGQGEIIPLPHLTHKS